MANYAPNAVPERMSSSTDPFSACTRVSSASEVMLEVRLDGADALATPVNLLKKPDRLGTALEVEGVVVFVVATLSVDDAADDATEGVLLRGGEAAGVAYASRPWG